MNRKKVSNPDDFAPLPKKPILVDEDGFDKAIARLLKDSSVGFRIFSTSSASASFCASSPSTGD
jgi:hypothetical protein